jgi:hypothetical protein
VTARDRNPKLNGAPSTFFYPEKVEMEKVDCGRVFPPDGEKVDRTAGPQIGQCPAEIGLEAGACGETLVFRGMREATGKRGAWVIGSRGTNTLDIEWRRCGRRLFGRPIRLTDRPLLFGFRCLKKVTGERRGRRGIGVSTNLEKE